jgi:hypothetical protein
MEMLLSIITPFYKGLLIGLFLGFFVGTVLLGFWMTVRRENQTHNLS